MVTMMMGVAISKLVSVIVLVFLVCMGVEGTLGIFISAETIMEMAFFFFWSSQLFLLLLLPFFFFVFFCFFIFFKYIMVQSEESHGVP